jgi:GDP-L-fucose synthase|tara:strand:- start:1299 stop:2174 length:876 start_codon:yes stop_codon:yes gene_type:complete
MKLLIIGGTGFIGKNLKQYFEGKEDFEVYAPTRQELDLFDDKACLDFVKKLKPDLVIHSAVDITSVENTLKVFFNIYSTKDYFGHMVQIGSGAEYDKRAYEPRMKESLFKKSIPIDTYGLGKFCIANVLENNEKNKVTNLRLFGIFGRYEDYSRRFISNNICNSLAGLPVSLNRNMLFDFIWVDDFSRFLHSVLGKLPLSSMSYNFCSGSPVSLINLAEIINKLMSNSTDIIVKNPGMNPEYSGDPSMIFDEIGEFDFTSFESSISRLIEFYKKTLTDEDIEIFRRNAIGK